MTNIIFARKLQMTGKFTPEGRHAGATILEMLPMTVESLRESGKHGYAAVRYKVTDTRYRNKTILREVRTEETPDAGTEIKLEEVLQAGDKVAVTGVSKGKGFAGAVKRHGFAGGPRTHGQSDRERAPGSSGSTTTPGRVYKGKRRAGHMGTDTITLKNLKVLDINAEKKLITLIGSVPGANRYTLLTIKKLS